ncbi:hypothetical protein ACS0TY_001784 [Phlomoides rotata]
MQSRSHDPAHISENQLCIVGDKLLWSLVFIDCLCLDFALFYRESAVHCWRQAAVEDEYRVAEITVAAVPAASYDAVTPLESPTIFSPADGGAASKRIGTHSGKFHCDEALGCFMIRRTENFYGADIIRTRDSMVLDKLGAVLDVIGVYNSSRDRYDHHQEGFQEVFGYGFETKLSSAGSVYKRYGKEIISKEVKLDPDHCDVHRLFVTIYKNFIETMESVNTTKDKLPRFVNNTSLSSRVERLNPDWIDLDQSSAKEDEAFQQAMKLAGNELLECIHFHAKSWLPTRKNVDSNGEIIVLTLMRFYPSFFNAGSFPLKSSLMKLMFLQWKLHIFELEKEMKITHSIKYVIYPFSF